MSGLKLYKGLFITFEGGEGSGKTTHVALLGEKLRSMGYDVLVTKEPGAGESSICRDIRSMLLQEREEPLAPIAELLLFHADRAQHIEQSIRPALANKRIVLCDRFSGSTWAYQRTRGHGPAILRYLQELVQGGIYPDFTVFLDPGEEEARSRMAWRNKEEGNTELRFDNEAVSFHEEVWRRYRAMYPRRGAPDLIHVDSSGDIDSTHQFLVSSILKAIEPFQESPNV